MSDSPSNNACEVHVLKDKRWELHKRYDAKDRKAAIQEAKRVGEAPGIDGAKVVSIEFQAGQAKSQAQTIFKTYRLERDYTAKSTDTRAGTSTSAQRGERPLSATKKSDPKRFGKFRSRLAGVAFGIVGGTVLLGASLLAPGGSDALGRRFGIENVTLLLAGIFGLGFLLAFLATLLWFKTEKAQTARNRVEGVLDSGRRKSTLSQAEGAGNSAVSSNAPSGSIPPSANSGAEQSTASRASSETPRPYAEKQIAAMTRFVANLLRYCDSRNDRNTANDTLAVDLLLAGATTALTESRSLDTKTETLIFREALQLTGRNVHQAEEVIDTLEGEIQKIPTSNMVMRLGYDAMKAFLEGETDFSAPVTRAYGLLRNPIEETVGASTAVMFVDVAAATDRGQESDDIPAAYAIEIRDRVLRDALGTCGGIEVRNTGRGIMAAFPTANRAVEASAIIQRKVATLNFNRPTQKTHLCIGVDSGVPEPDEIVPSGAAETAVWACRKARPDQILVAEAAYSEARNCGLPFKDAGTHAFSDLYDEIRLFEAVWQSTGFQKSTRH